MIRPGVFLLLGVTLLVSALARPAAASGMGIPDVGASALGQGAATVARPDDLTSVWYNPAGLASQPGLRIHTELRLVDHQVRFQRTDASGDPLGYRPVTNEGGISGAPLLGLSYQFQPRGWFPITVAAGGHPFNGYSGYRYPDPMRVREDPEIQEISNPNIRQEEIGDRTPQRYAAIESNSVVFVPFVAVAARLAPWVDVGITFQSGLANFRSRQAIFANVMESGENSSYDGVFTVDAWDRFAPSAAVGASFTLMEGLYAGLSMQLPMRFRAKGKLSIELTPELEQIGADMVGDDAEVEVNFPMYLRAGVRLVRPAFEVELAGTYDAWSSFEEIRLIPRDVAVKIGETVTPLPDLPIRKELVDAGSLRLGGVLKPGRWVKALDWLVLRGGMVAESSALPSHRQSLDIAHWERISLNAGLGFRFDRFHASVGYAYFIQPDRQIRDSEVKQIVAFPNDPERPPTIIANGNYESKIHVFGLMVSAHL